MGTEVQYRTPSPLLAKRLCVRRVSRNIIDRELAAERYNSTLANLARLIGSNEVGRGQHFADLKAFPQRALTIAKRPQGLVPQLAGIHVESNGFTTREVREQCFRNATIEGSAHHVGHAVDIDCEEMGLFWQRREDLHQHVLALETVLNLSHGGRLPLQC